MGKANRTLEFLRQNLGKCPVSVQNQAYSTLIRPHLVYCGSVWDPHTHKHLKDIVGIQRRAARFFNGCYCRVPGTVTNLDQLEWSSSHQRRQMSFLTMMYKIVNDLNCPVQIPGYVQKKIRITRSFHRKRFINLYSKNNTYKYRFCIRTVKEWNGLPDELIEQETLESFKSALANYLNH